MNGHQFCDQKIQFMEKVNWIQNFGRWTKNQQELTRVIEEQFFKKKIAEFQAMKRDSDIWMILKHK